MFYTTVPVAIQVQPPSYFTYTLTEDRQDTLPVRHSSRFICCTLISRIFKKKKTSYIIVYVGVT